MRRSAIGPVGALYGADAVDLLDRLTAATETREGLRTVEIAVGDDGVRVKINEIAWSPPRGRKVAE